MGGVPIHVEHPRDDHDRPRENRRDMVGGAAIVAAIVGVASVVLAIVGLAGALPVTFASIATICAGVALLLEGGAITTRLQQLGRALATEEMEVSAGLGAESIAGVGAIALGILALLRIDELTLLPVASIVIGAGLLLGSAVMARVNSIPSGAEPARDTAAFIARENIYAASGAHVLVGAGAIVLGILALLGTDTLTLVLVSLLCIGASLLLSGAAVGGRLVGAFRH
jgi:hypothetical protein